jgi:hypothetical protein
MTGIRGVYLVAAELSRLGFIASPTSRSAAGADLLVTDPCCKRACSVQVKTNARTFNFWLIGSKAKETVSDAHIYVLVHLKDNKRQGLQIEYFVIPSKDLSHQGHHDGAWPHIRRDKILEYRDAWDAFGDIG